MAMTTLPHGFIQLNAPDTENMLTFSNDTYTLVGVVGERRMTKVERNSLKPLDIPSTEISGDTFTGPGTFHRFNDLPNELKCKIWQMSMPVKEVIHDWNPELESLKRPEPVAALSICAESRHEALRVYTPIPHPNGICYVDLSNDKFYFNSEHVCASLFTEEDPSDPAITFDPSTLDRMKNIVLSAGSFIDMQVADDLRTPFLRENYTSESIQAYLHKVSLCTPTAVDRTYAVRILDITNTAKEVGDISDIFYQPSGRLMITLHWMAESFAMIRQGIALLGTVPCSFCHPISEIQTSPTSHAAHHMSNTSAPASNPTVIFQLITSTSQYRYLFPCSLHNVEYWTYHDVELDIAIDIMCMQEED